MRKNQPQGEYVEKQEVNQIQRVIEESLKGFENNFKDSFTYGAMQSWEDGEVVKSYISTTISNILSAIKKEVEGKKKTKWLNQPNGLLPIDGFNFALSDIQSLLEQAKKQIK